MNNKKTLIIVALVLVLLIGGASALYGKLSDSYKTDNLAVQNGSGMKEDGSEEDAASDGTERNDGNEASESNPAPDFTVYDENGNAVSLSDFTGKPVIVNFWASWCGPCKSEMPDFEKVFAEYGENIHFLMVNMTDGYQETEEKAKSFISESGYTFPVYYDSDMDAAQTYYVYSIPTTYFVDAEGNLIAQGTGALDMDTLKKGIGMIYGQ